MAKVPYCDYVICWSATDVMLKHSNMERFKTIPIFDAGKKLKRNKMKFNHAICSSYELKGKNSWRLGLDNYKLGLNDWSLPNLRIQ